MSLEKNRVFNTLSDAADKFYHSGWYIGILTLAGIIGFVFKYEWQTIYFVTIIMSIGWVFCKDLLPTFLVMFIIAMTPLARYGELNYFDPLYYLVFIIVPAFLIRLFAFPIKIKLGRFFLPTLAVAIAITVGGLGYLSFKEYFSMPGIFYVGMLGVAMVVINIVLESNIPENRWDNINFFAKMMVGVGIMGIAMVVTTYTKYFSFIDEGRIGYFSNAYFQWGNNLSNCLLLSMPFSFYLALKKSKVSPLYFALGILQYLAMLLSFSRGGIIFGSLIVVPLVVTTIILAKKDWLKLIVTGTILLAVVSVLFFVYLYPVVENLLKTITVSGDEARVNLYRLAWENFLKLPVFGTGLQYDGGLYYHPQAMCIYWYHSTFFQIVGSLGVVGVVAYLIQFIYRAKALLEVKSLFNLFVLFSVLGFAGYSMVNVGYFAPFPYVVGMLQIFIMVGRSNSMLKENPKLMESERVFSRNKKI